MKRTLLLSLLSILILGACSSSDTITFDDIHKEDNEAQFAKIAASSEYERMYSKSNGGFIMYKVLKEGEKSEDSVSPLFTDEVKVNYTGWYKQFWTKDDVFTDEKGKDFQNKYIFDTTVTNQETGTVVPRTFPVGGLVDGFTTALQYMHVGDKWEIWIPWALGYGEYGQGNIRGHTTMVFEVELLEINPKKKK